MKCAKCLWKWLDQPSTPGRSWADTNDAVTTYRGHALCLGHLIEQQVDNRAAGRDPWR